jgi:hypothetical protein
MPAMAYVISKFHNSIIAAQLAGLSVRHFRRVCIAAGINPLNFGNGKSRNFKYTDEMIALAVKWIRAHPAGGGKRGARTNARQKSLKIAKAS